jgi:hypothetical protein
VLRIPICKAFWKKVKEKVIELEHQTSFTVLESILTKSSLPPNTFLSMSYGEIFQND